jgi:hypothetical protein
MTSGDRDKGEKKFSFGFANAGRISKVIAGLKTTSALGTDGILVSVLKMGSEALAGPISHLVNMSLSAGVFPSAFKTALIHPVYKGGGKARNDPASYRPVAILCALSKVLKTVAKEDLEAHMAANNILPTSQHGFRRGRSCSTALATAHAAWVAAKAKGKVVALVGFDLSSEFDTVGREDLLPKMEAMGIRGRSIKWLRSYLTDARQRVVWDGQVSDVVDVEYGVRRGPCLARCLTCSTSRTCPSPWRSGIAMGTAATRMTRLSGLWQRTMRKRTASSDVWSTFPVVVAVKVHRVAPTTKTMQRRNFKALERPALLHALETWLWSDVYVIVGDIESDTACGQHLLEFCSRKLGATIGHQTLYWLAAGLL